MAPLVRERWPELNGKPYLPHAILTTRLRPPEAMTLVEAAARLDHKFVVDEIWLLEAVPTRTGPDAMQPLQVFMLGDEGAVRLCARPTD